MFVLMEFIQKLNDKDQCQKINFKRILDNAIIHMILFNAVN